MFPPPARHILVVDRDSGRHRKKEAASPNAGVIPLVVATVSEAVRELELAGYDAVFVRMDGPDELSLMLRIRGAAPEIPLCALIPESNEDFELLARESGADEVLSIDRDPGKADAALGRALASTDELIRRSRAVVARSEKLREEARKLRARSIALRDSSLDLKNVPIKDLVTLVVEDDPDHDFFLRRAWHKLKLPIPLPVLGNGKEAISYLGGEGKYADRDRYPLPTLIVLDLHLPRRDGYEVLEWIRSQPDLKKLVVFVFTTSPRRQDLDRALAIGADCFFIKPVDLNGLDTIALRMAVRWGLLYRFHRLKK